LRISPLSGVKNDFAQSHATEMQSLEHTKLWHERAKPQHLVMDFFVIFSRSILSFKVQIIEYLILFFMYFIFKK
jgi:hypothetical protein